MYRGMARASSPIRNRGALLRILRAHPEWTLRQALEVAPRRVLQHVRLGELVAPSDLARLARAERLSGAKFDACVLSVIREAGRPVAAAYLRARVGGPRWKLQDAVGRLAQTGKIERSGTTSATRYWCRRSRGKR
jgi:hypothetical protein